MTALLFGKYLLVSRPRYDENLGVWFAYASVSWAVEEFEYHQIKAAEKVFDTENEAFAYGFMVARAWVKKTANLVASRFDRCASWSNAAVSI